MTERPMLPRPGEIDLVVARIRRRWRQRAVTGVAGVVLVATAVPAWLDHAARGPLDTIEPAPPVSGVPTSAPARSPEPRDGGLLPAATATAETRVAPRPAAVATVTGARTPAVPAAPAAPAARPATKPPVRTYTVERPDHICSPRVDPASPEVGGLCLAAVSSPLPGGWHTSFSVFLCAPAGAQQETATYASALETDFVVLRDGRRVWTWSAGQEFPPGQHHVAVQPRTCQVWTVTWPATDEAGQPVRAGRYQFRGISLATQLGDDNAAEADFTLE